MTKKINKEGYDFYFWEYEEQTKVKHFVLQEYFDKWVKILGKWNGLNFIDGYGGCGVYIENDKIFWGSPILAAETIERNRENLCRKVNLIIIEEDRENVENLQKIFKYKNLKLNPYIIEGEFDTTINNILDEVKNQLRPTFFFIDPYGFKISYETLKRIMSIPKSEIFLNFMFTQLNRFLIDELEYTLSKLFGCEEWRDCTNFEGHERENKIVELYRKQLKKISKFVFNYRMSFPTKARTYYYLYHMTNHQLGCSLMKSCFAKYNYGLVEYRGLRKDEPTFFDSEGYKISEMKCNIMNKYSRQKKSYNEIISENIDEIPFLEKEIKISLKELESENKINVDRIESKKSGIKGNDIIIFI